MVVDPPGDASRQAVYDELQGKIFALQNSILELEDKGLNFSRYAAQVGSFQFVVFMQVGVELGARRLLKRDFLLLLLHWLRSAKSS